MSPTSQPVVSIIIPNHNKGVFIRETLDSLVSQTFSDWEAIVVDDGSTDKSISIVDEYISKDSRFRILGLSKQQHGGSVCRNRGLMEARSEFVIFLDSDDVLSRTCLENRVSLLTQRVGLDFLVFPLQTFIKTPGEKGYKWMPRTSQALERFLSHDLPWQTMQPIYRKTFLDKGFKFPENVSRLQDVFLHTEIMLSTPAFDTVSDDVDCYFRVSQGRHSQKPDEFYVNWAESIKAYVNHFYPRLSMVQQRALMVTVLYGMTELNYARLAHRINAKLQRKTLSIILQAHLLSQKKFWIYSYSWLIWLPFHVPGLRRVFSWLLKR